MKKILFLLSMFCCLNFLSAQEFKFKHIGKEKGLSQSRINAILQDQDGFLWFGTDDGLNKYNGQQISVFKNDSRNEKSISDNWINCLWQDPSGVLWIGTLEGGLNRYDKYSRTFTTYNFDPYNEKTLSSNTVQCIVGNDKNSFWVGTDNGLNLFDISTGQVKRFMDEMVNPNNPKSVIKNDNIRCLFKDSEGVLWIGTYKSGLLSYDTKKNEFQDRNEILPNGNFKHLNTNRIRAIYETSEGVLWIGYDGGFLAKLDRKTGIYTHYVNSENDLKSLSSNRITSIIEDHNGQLWIATSDGINLYDPVNDNFRVVKSVDKNPFSLKDNFIRVLFEDKANSVWIGTDAYGVSVFHRSIGKFQHISNESYDVSGLKNNTIFCFEEDNNNNIWIGTIGDGLAFFDREKNTFTHYKRDKNYTHDNILCLQKVNNKLWFGTWGGGLNYYDFDKNIFHNTSISTGATSNLSNDNVIDIEVDEKGNLWLATLRGLNYYNVENKSIQSYLTGDGLPHNTLYCLYYQNSENLWIGTNGGGLLRFNTKTKKFDQWLKGGKNTLSNNTVHCITPDGKGNIWLGTKNGLSKFIIAENKFENYTESDGLTNNFIVGILIDKAGVLWISTYNGLSKFNPNMNESSINRKYFAIDGLQGDEFNQNAFFKTKSGEFFFGGIGGFNHFYPESIVDNPYVPPVVLTSFKIAGKDVDLDSSILFKRFIELSYRKNFFAFEFASLDYILPEKVLYSYQMQGLSQEWSVPSNRPYASFTDLQGGDYVFKVKATNSDGVWNESGTAIHIRIIPPFYKTKLFYSLCLFLTILLVFVIIRVRVSAIKKEKRRLEEMVEQRTKELAEKNKDITASIEYAKRIQEAILPDKSVIFEHLPNSFILYRPKDIVSGDFYWYARVDNKDIIAVVDCTGHGVPGAFMSMIGHNLLNQIIVENKILDPGKVLELLRTGVRSVLKQESGAKESSDGMDISLCVFDQKNNEIKYAGAFRPLIIIKNNSLEKIEGTKSPIGGAKLEIIEDYQTHTRQLKSGDSFYMYTDGYVDQFGGDFGKKFMGKTLHRLLLEIQDKSMTEQNFLLLESFERWMGSLEQVDDVLVIGVKVN